MRAVNLIPQESRRGGGAGGAGRSGGAAYIMLGGLAVLVALVAAWAYTGRTVNQHRAELRSLDSQVQQLQARTAGSTAAQPDAASAQERLATVRALATARTDWAKTMDAIARTLPATTSLTSLTAATSPTATAGGTGGSGAIASSSTGPSIQIGGCSPSQKAVAQLMPRLRVIPGVQHVMLTNSQRMEAGTAAAGSGGSDCSRVSFNLVVFMTPTAPPAAPAVGPTAAATAAPAAPAAPAPTGAGQ